MDKQSITRDIKKEIGSFPTTGAIAKYLGVGRDSVKTLMLDYECIKIGRCHKYYAGDIAQMILERRE